MVFQCSLGSYLGRAFEIIKAAKQATTAVIGKAVTDKKTPYSLYMCLLSTRPLCGNLYY